MESSSPCRSLNSHILYATNRENFVLQQIIPAIRDKSCPICLRHIDDRRAALITACLHAYCVDCITKWSNLKRKCPLCNAAFDAWFFKINLSSRTFIKQKLPAIVEDRKASVGFLRQRRRDPLEERRAVRRSREEINRLSRQRRPLPRRRWFGRSGSETSDVVAERVLQWRASIYELHLEAVPFVSRFSLQQNTEGNVGVKERILERIEPWIFRELQAILQDLDPSVIVHVASSLFISSLEQKRENSSEQFVPEDNFLAPLRPFLHGRTSMFWHELRCFTESPFNVETYDTVVEYRKL